LDKKKQSSQVRYNYEMARTWSSNLKIDRKALSVGSLTDPSDEKAYWLARPPAERLKQVEILRRINYGHRATVRLQRVLEITEREFEVGKTLSLEPVIELALKNKSE